MRNLILICLAFPATVKLTSRVFEKISLKLFFGFDGYFKRKVRKMFKHKNCLENDVSELQRAFMQ